MRKGESRGINQSQAAFVVGNKHERWSISQPTSQQPVIETQGRTGNRGI